MKKVKKIIILVSAFAMPNIASPQSCNCYNQFNSAFSAATAMYVTCISNYLSAPVGAWAAYYGGNYGGAGGSIGSAINGFLNCQNSYYTIWNQLGQQFDYCVTKYCN